MKEKVRSQKGFEKSKIVGNHEEWIRRLARSLVFDSNQAEDIVQQTWLEMFRRPPAKEGNLRGWLTVVVKNVARKMKRSDRNREKRERRSAKSEEIFEIPLGKQDKDSLQKSILRAVESLDEPYRATIRMRYFEELSPAEIAKRSQTPIDTVYTRLRRGLAQLRAKLDKSYGGDRNLWIGIALQMLPAPKASPAVALRSRHGFAAAAAAATVIVPGWLLLANPETPPVETERVAKQSEPTAPREELIADSRELVPSDTETPAEANPPEAFEESADPIPEAAEEAPANTESPAEPAPVIPNRSKPSMRMYGMSDGPGRAAQPIKGAGNHGKTAGGAKKSPLVFKTNVMYGQKKSP